MRDRSLKTKQGKTERNFPFVEFKDYSARQCSLQASSLAIYQEPGTSAIWLGVERDPNGRHVTHGRMHLTRKQVLRLIGLLQQWSLNGKFKKQ